MKEIKLKITSKNTKGVNLQKGVTLIALVITIIVLLILAGITLNLALDEDGLIARAKETVAKYKEIQEKEEKEIRELEGQLADNFGEFDRYGRIKVNPPELRDGMIPIKYDKEKSKWVITNKDDEEWYDYSEEKMLWANVMLSDGKYKTSEKEDNSKEGHYSDDGTTVVEDNDLGSMFVWIPRYAYSFNKYHTKMDNEEGTTQKITNVVFLNGRSNKDYKNNSYPTTYDAEEVEEGQPTPMIVHPGFTFGDNELTGIWVGKFEASMSGKNTNTEDNNNVIYNSENNSHILKVIPDAETWRMIEIGNCFWNCYYMNEDKNVYGINSLQVDTHLMKNIEWGVVSYISASEYGVVPEINNFCEIESEDIYHGYASSKDYKSNEKQSTTGNVTGIYDMCGGSWEYVAAYYDNLDGFIEEFGGKDLFENRILNESYTKYWDKYEVGEKERTVVETENGFRNIEIWEKLSEKNEERKNITNERYKLMKNKLGDGMYEVVGNTYSYFGWSNDKNSYDWLKYKEDSDFNSGCYNHDFANIGNCALPFVERGGSYDHESNAGIFAFQGAYGSYYWMRAFRPVLVM